jgi:hypothetical protein
MAVRATGAWTSTSTYRVRWAVRAWARHQSGAALRGRLRRLLPVVDAAVRLRAQARPERLSHRRAHRHRNSQDHDHPPAPPLGGWSLGVRGSRSPSHSGSCTATAAGPLVVVLYRLHAAGGLTLFVLAAAALVPLLAAYTATRRRGSAQHRGGIAPGGRRAAPAEPRQGRFARLRAARARDARRGGCIRGRGGPANRVAERRDAKRKIGRFPPAVCA